MMMLSDIPIPFLLFGAALLGLLLRYARLRFQQAKTAAEWEGCHDALVRIGEGLRAYAEAHGGRLPDTLDAALDAEAPCGYAYRFVPELETDGRLILAHDDSARHTLIRFPSLLGGRNVLFASGRVELFADEAVERLIVGDNVLRERLNLPEIPMEGGG